MDYGRSVWFTWKAGGLVSMSVFVGGKRVWLTNECVSLFVLDEVER